MPKKEFWILVFVFCLFVLAVLGIVQTLQVPVPPEVTIPALSTSLPSSTPTAGWWTDLPPFCTWTATPTPALQMTQSPTP